MKLGCQSLAMGTLAFIRIEKGYSRYQAKYAPWVNIAVQAELLEGQNGLRAGCFGSVSGDRTNLHLVVENRDE
jgi:hypothetical protein